VDEKAAAGSGRGGASVLQSETKDEEKRVILLILPQKGSLKAE
jgi:hypothetical protein